METSELISTVGEWVDVAGVALIVIGITSATLRFLARVLRQAPDTYARYREGLGKALLLGLEFLVAADIIRTVAVEPSFRGLGILGLIVLIRTFLSWSLELELEGRWPWQRGSEPAAKAEYHK